MKSFILSLLFLIGFSFVGKSKPLPQNKIEILQLSYDPCDALYHNLVRFYKQLGADDPEGKAGKARRSCESNK